MIIATTPPNTLIQRTEIQSLVVKVLILFLAEKIKGDKIIKAKKLVIKTDNTIGTPLNFSLKNPPSMPHKKEASKIASSPM